MQRRSAMALAARLALPQPRPSKKGAGHKDSLSGTVPYLLVQSLRPMPRRLLKRLVPSPGSLQSRWYLRVFGTRIADPCLWAPHRRAVTAAFGVGLAICFIPLPVHVFTACLLAIICRINLPVINATVFLVNPITVIPVYYVAYRVGALLLGLEPQSFAFEPSWDWLQNGLGPLWKPFLVGCLACAALSGVLGWIGLELIWRWRVTTRYKARREAPTVM